jgi:hypothetical protein
LTQTVAFALTLLIEAPVALLLGRFFRISPSGCALSAIIGSALTHPILWTVFHDVQPLLGALTTPVLEAAVFLAEAPVYRMLAARRWDDALLLSLLVNAVSWAVGEIMYVTM